MHGFMHDYYALPPDPHASLVLVPHLPGVDDGMRASADRFAAAGFATAVADLYAALAAPDPRLLTTPSIDRDLERVRTRLTAIAPAARCAIAGFCMGGRIAMVRCAGRRPAYAAAAIWYGFAAELDPATIDVPIVASYGSSDEHLPPAPIVDFFGRIPVETDVMVYPGAGHGFVHHADTHDPAATEDSFERAIAFLRRHTQTA